MINPFEMLKNLDQIKAKSEEIKKVAENIRCTGYAMGNMIEVVANGKMQIESLKIDPSLCKEGNAEMVEVLVASAVNNALENVRNRYSQEVAKMTGGMDLGLGL